MAICRLLNPHLVLFVLLALFTREAQAFDLFEAIEQKDKKAVESFLESGVDPNKANGAGDFPLHIAIDKNELEIVRILIASKADAALRNRNGHSSYFLASIVKQDLAMTAVLMKVKDNSANAVRYPSVSFGNGRQAPREFFDTASLVQWNEHFGYRFLASPDWKLNALQQDARFRKQSVVVLTLPPIWSDVEKQNIENAILVFASQEPSIQVLSDAVTSFQSSTPAAKEAKNQDKENPKLDRATFDYDQSQGPLTYKKRTVILFGNGIAYRIDFTATLGTFEKNLPLFTSFCDSIKFSKPKTK